MTNYPDKPPVVVKLGGSTSHDQSYQRWLKLLQSSEIRAVLAPGGGPFADAIRASQQSLGFNDATAHDLALLSMNQFGRVLLEHLPDARALQRTPHWRELPDHLSVWLPDPQEVNAHPDIERSWRTTGDTLACWLCTQLGVRDLILIKSVAHDTLQQPLSVLSRQGIIDPLCERWIDDHQLNVRLLGANANNAQQSFVI